MSLRVRARRVPWPVPVAVLALLFTAVHPAGAQLTYEPREISKQAYPTVEFQFHPQVGEGWVERTSAVVVLTWESASAESTVIDSVHREMTWEVVAETDSGYVVRWSYGPQQHFLNGVAREGLVAEYLEGRIYGLLVDPSGEALSELSAEELLAATRRRAGETDAMAGAPVSYGKEPWLETEAPAAGDSTPPGPPELADLPDSASIAAQPPPFDPLIGFALRDWNQRLDVFYGQIWDEGVSVFELENISVPGMSTQRLFSELWLERVISPEERPVAQIEIRYFTVPTDTLPLDDEGFLEFLTVQGISGLSSPALTDLVADGRGTWYIDAGRLLLYQGSSVIEGMVQQWPSEGSGSSITARFTIRRQYRADPLLH